MGGRRRHRVLLSLGSNIDKRRNIVRAVALLREALRVMAVSSVYETAPVGGPGQPSYFNAAILAETKLSPAALKARVLAPIERRLGRRRTADRFAPRTIDIDIAFFNDEVRRVGNRTIPDPDTLTRPHLAVPLAEVAPDFRHPVAGRSLREIAQAMPGRTEVRRRPDVALTV